MSNSKKNPLIKSFDLFCIKCKTVFNVQKLEKKKNRLTPSCIKSKNKWENLIK